MEDDQGQIFEVESTFYSNCLLLGYDASKTGVELSRHMFRHSNPKGGEAVLYFLLSCIRPQQIQKDFHGVWPIFDARQARDFRKVVQSLLAELEVSKDLPRSNSRLSSLATCCGERFMELVWQLSAHALREVLLRMSSVGTMQVPVRLTEVAQQPEYASALVPVTKARIALQRKRFLSSAAAAVERQDEWAGLADEITAEHRALSAEQASLQQQLLDARGNGHAGSGSIDEKVTGLVRAKEVQLATDLWSSLMKHTEDSQRMTSGHLQDVLTLREHRYRIDGAALRKAMQSGQDPLPPNPGSTSSASSRSEFETGRAVSTVRTAAAEPLDVVDMLQSWTGALQASQQQLQQGKTVSPIISDGEGSHGQALEAALAEHKKHLANLQALVTSLKEQTPRSEGTVERLREQVGEVMAEASQSGGLLSEPPSTPIQKTSGAPFARPLDDRSKTARLQLVPPTPAMKLGQKKHSVRNNPGTLDSLGEDEECESDSEKRTESGTAGGNKRLGARLLGSLFGDEKPSASEDSQSTDQLRKSIRESVAARREVGNVAANGTMTAASRNLPFATPSQNLQTPFWSGSAVTGSSRPRVVARLDMDRGVVGGRFSGGDVQSSVRSMPPPREVTTGRLRESGRGGRLGALLRGQNVTSEIRSGAASTSETGQTNDGDDSADPSVADVTRSRTAASQAERDFVEEPVSDSRGLDSGLGRGLNSRSVNPSTRGPRESSASRQSVSGWTSERILSPPLQVEVDGDLDDGFDLLAPLKAQDLNFHTPRGQPRTGRSVPSGKE